MNKFLVWGLLLLHVGRAQDMTNNGSPYRTDWFLDGITVGGGLAVAITASAVDDKLPVPSAVDIARLRRTEVNAFDRIAAGNYSKTQMSISDAALIAAFASPMTLLADRRIREDWGTMVIMYTEMALYSNFIPSYGKGSVQRYRPFVYNTSAPMNEKQDVESLRSFFSGHATRAFAAGVMTAVIYGDYYPDSPYRLHVWVASLGTAAGCAALRVTSGAHFPTDVITGAAVGSAIGYLIPFIHRHSPNEFSIRPLVTPTGSVVSMTVRF